MTDIVPLFSPMVDTFGGLTIGMDFVNRALFAIQGEYARYLKEMLTSPTYVAAPDYKWIIGAMSSGQVDRLSSMPAAWYALTSAPQNPLRNLRDLAEPSTSTRSQAGAVTKPNNSANPKLLSRFASCGSASISHMMEGHSPTIPKHRGKEICLTWALKGACGNTCKRKEQHVHYPPAVVHSVHEMLDACGVAPSSD